MWPLRLWGFESPFSHHIFPIWLAICFSAGCAAAPEAVVLNAFRAASANDWDAYFASFTEDSEAVLRGLDEMAGNGQGNLGLKGMEEAIAIISVEMLEVPVSLPTRDGDIRLVRGALVEARVGGQVLSFPVVEERGGWRIHFFALQQRWHRQGLLSNGLISP